MAPTFQNENGKIEWCIWRNFLVSDWKWTLNGKKRLQPCYSNLNESLANFYLLNYFSIHVTSKWLWDVPTEEGPLVVQIERFGFGNKEKCSFEGKTLEKLSNQNHLHMCGTILMMHELKRKKKIESSIKKIIFHTNEVITKQIEYRRNQEIGEISSAENA